MKKRFFPPKKDFSSLSLKDLLEARDAYHVHLAHLENVIATAVGRYRIREQDPDAGSAKGPKEWRGREQAPERTLGNTVVRPWSWPCVTVFVREWFSIEELARQDPDQVVPRFLYLSDGRVVPTCVILANRQEVAPPPLQNITFPEHLVGGGYPVFTEKQGQQHVGSVGCLVTDGDSVYALTNRHVTGEAGQEIFTFVGGKKLRVGVSSASRLDERAALGKRLFKDVYKGWPGERSYVNLDAGLIRIDDIEYWTSQVFGIGEIGDPVDLNTDTLSLDLVGCPVRAFGAASGELTGEVSALFYRYKSIGGFEYISDLLIGPRTETSREFWKADREDDDEPAEPEDAPLPGAGGAMKTRPGDSGTVWFFDQNISMERARALGRAGARARRLRPIALQWGGHTLMDGVGESKAEFALATCLSTVCRELDLDIIPDFDIGHSEYWGKTGHYKIAAKACELVPDAKLKKLLTANVSNIAFGDQAIKDGELKKANPVTPSKPNQPFVPLADVPDLVWRASRKLDDSNHFADMDQPGGAGTAFAGKTLLDLCKNPSKVDIAVWNEFYDSIGVKSKRGALPFRVWQVYDLMVEFVRQKKVAEFVCAGGIVSHYVGDACQPLHVSALHHGRPDHPEEEKVHSVYETQMIDKKATDVIAGINEALKGKKAKADVKGGHAAAVSVIALMRQTFKTLPPIEIIEAFNGAPPNDRLGHMWDVLGERTVTCMSAGCLRMASLWESAWVEGGGGKIGNANLDEIKHAQLMSLYNNKNFMPAFRLQDQGFADALK
jgi:hypothetical protein